MSSTPTGNGGDDAVTTPPAGEESILGKYYF